MKTHSTSKGVLCYPLLTALISLSSPLRLMPMRWSPTLGPSFPAAIGLWLSVGKLHVPLAGGLLIPKVLLSKPT